MRPSRAHRTTAGIPAFRAATSGSATGSKSTCSRSSYSAMSMCGRPMLLGTVFTVVYLWFAIAVVVLASSLARTVAVAAALAVGILLALPILGAIPDVKPWLPAFLLASLMATSVGFGLAQLVRNPLVVNVIVNVLIFVVLMFSPVVFPIAQLPVWLADVHRVLPIYHLAQVLRASVTTGLVRDVGVSYAVLAAWTVAAWIGAAWVIGHRR